MRHNIFIAHVNDVTENISKPVVQLQKKLAVFNKSHEHLLVNNICPHQGSLIASEAQQGLRCRFHGWSWDNSGVAVDAGSTKLCNSSKISMHKTYTDNSLIFSNAIDLSAISDFNLSHMQLVDQRVDVVHSNFKNIMDIFLDVDHIPIVHSKVYDKIGVDESGVAWKFYDWGSIQLVDKNNSTDSQFQNSLLNLPEEKLGAFWLAVFPYTMIEWQPGAMFITVCVPDGDKTKVTVMRYRDTRYSELNWNINAGIWETAWQQDKQQSESIVVRCEYDGHLEESKQHFRQWERKNEIT